ncbi:MAG: hypothetical protein LBS69_04655 [Prevotellaceae bacterium]|jgi:hypothetical protein|nr:hypothetical protein [Prevotellaceae bacterium]
MCKRKNSNRHISEDEYVNYYMRQTIPYEGYVTGKGYAFFRYDTICPATCNISGTMFWDNYTPTMCIQAIDTSDYMKERSWNVTPEEISKLLVRNNPDGTMTVSLGTNNEITLSKEHGKCQISIEDTGTEVNVHVTVEDVKYENENRNKKKYTKSCRLKDFRHVFEPVSSSFSYSPGGMEMLKSGVEEEKKEEFDWMDAVNFGIGGLSSYNTYKSGYFKYNELWHKTKTRGVAWKFQERWENPGAKYWRQQQVKPFEVARTTGKFGKYVRKAGPVVLVADVAMSGEIRSSHLINAGMLAASTTGIGSVIAVVWFVADFGTMGVNWMIGNGAKGLGDIIDEAVGGPIIELYEGWY